MLWQAKVNGSYQDMKTPSSYDIDWEDIDSNSYRSVTTGNLIRERLSSKWFKGKFSFNYLTESEIETILTVINQNPIYVKVKDPLFGTSGVAEFECYCSKVSVSMQKNEATGANWKSLSFNIIQQTKVSGQ